MKVGYKGPNYRVEFINRVQYLFRLRDEGDKRPSAIVSNPDHVKKILVKDDRFFLWPVEEAGGGGDDDIAVVEEDYVAPTPRKKRKYTRRAK